MKNKIACFALTCLFHFQVSFAQDVKWESLEWANDVKAMLSEFLSCGGPTPPNTPCNTFLGQALKRIYNINDFHIPGSSQYTTANNIAAYVENDEKWTLLGSATNQTTLNNAQGYANLKKAVIAVQYVSSGHGHVCLVIPGTLKSSGSWKLNCPNSASFFLNKPNKSYVGNMLSFAFSDPGEVRLYGRNF